MLLVLSIFSLVKDFGTSASGEYLSEGELAWLEAHQDNIIIGPDPMAPPLDMFNDSGEHIGLSADYLALIQKSLATQFTTVRYPSWKQLLEAAKNKQVSIVSLAAKTQEREKYLSFTVPIAYIPNVIISDKNNKTVTNLKSLTGKRVAVTAGYAIQEHLQHHYPDIHLISVKKPLEGLMQVAFGGVDSMVLDLSQASYLTQKHAFTNLKVSGDVGYELILSFAVRKDWPELLNILNKAIATIDPHSRKAIFNKWINLEEITLWQTSFLWKITTWALFILSLLTSIILFLNYLLRRKVDQRTADLQSQLVLRVNSEKEMLPILGLLLMGPPINVSVIFFVKSNVNIS
jgi:polar amino acid transport system substrate-binding protein